MKKLIILFAFLAACTTEDKEVEPEVSAKMKALTAKPWVVSAFQIEDSRQPNYIVDNYKFLVACEKDDSFTFNADGTWVLSENAKKCNFVGSDPRNFNGTWKLSDQDTKLTLSKWMSNSGTWDVIEVNEASLKLSYLFNEVGFTRKNTISLSHQ